MSFKKIFMKPEYIFSQMFILQYWVIAYICYQRGYFSVIAQYIIETEVLFFVLQHQPKFVLEKVYIWGKILISMKNGKS